MTRSAALTMSLIAAVGTTRAEEVIWRAVEKPARTPSPVARAQSDPLMPDDGASFSPAIAAEASVAPTAFAGPQAAPPAFHSPNITIAQESVLSDAVYDPGFVSRSYFQAEYLLWWVKRDVVPPLATTGSPASLGILGNPDTQVLIGGGGLENGEARNGFRLRGGTWLDECQTCGIDASFFYLSPFNSRTTIPAGQFPVLARPIFAPNFNAEFVELVAFPGVSTGGLEVTSESELLGADVNLRKALCCTCDLRAEVFAGYRFVSLEESLQVTEFITALDMAPDPAGTQIVVFDRFETENSFHGGQIGTHVERWFGRWVLDARGSVAFGNTRQEVEISGMQIRQQPGMAVPDMFVGGLLTTPGNVGRFERDRFSVVPEVTLNLGYQLSDHFRVFAGYNFLYWSNVVRPGDQVDRVVDVALVPNPPMNVPPSGLNRPTVLFEENDIWVQGLNFGIQARW